MPRTDRRNRTRYWVDRVTPGLSLLHADFTDHGFAPHYHDALVVAVTETGGSVFKSRGEVQDAHPADLLIFNPAEGHSGTMGWSQRWRYRSLYLEQSAIDAVNRLLGIDRMPYFTVNTVRDRDLIAAFAALHRVLDGPADAVCRQSRLADAFGWLFRRYGSGGPQGAAAPCDATLLKRAATMVRERHAEPLTLDALAESVGLTPFQLIGLFNRTMGMPPYAYLTQIRLRAAMRHLRSGLPIAEAAVAAGFYDQSAFTRHLKKAYAITPGQFLSAAD